MPVRIFEAIGRDESATQRKAAIKRLEEKMSEYMKENRHLNPRVQGFTYGEGAASAQDIFHALIVTDDPPEKLCSKCGEREPLVNDYLCGECR